MLAELAEHGSASEAARVMGLTQSAVSKGLSRWQEDEGVRLFEFVNGRVVFTAAGDALLPIARRMVEDERLAQLCLNGFRQGGVLSILTSESFGIYYLPSVLRRMRSRWPGTRVRVCLVHNASIEERIAACTHDVGIVSGPGRNPLLSYHHLLDDEIVLVASPAHDLAGRTVEPEELSGRSFVMHDPGSVPRMLVDELFSRRRVDARVPIEVSNVETMKELAREDVGLAFLSRRSVRKEIETGALSTIEIAGERLARAFFLVQRRRRDESSAMRRLYHTIREDDQGRDPRIAHDSASPGDDAESWAEAPRG